MEDNRQNRNNNGDASKSGFEKFDMLNNDSVEKFKSLTEDNPEVLQEIMSSFIEESNTLIKDIEDSIEDSEMDKFRANVHSFKGLLATIGATRLFEISKHIDHNNKQENFDVARKYFPLLKSTYLELEQIIKDEFL